MIGKAILIMVLMNIGFKRQASSDKTFGLSANLRQESMKIEYIGEVLSK